jgi:hypothetical protein
MVVALQQLAVAPGAGIWHFPKLFVGRQLPAAHSGGRGYSKTTAGASKS